MIDDSAFDDAIDVVTVLFGLVQRLQKERPNTLPRHISIRALPKAPADTVNRQRAPLLIDV